MHMQACDSMNESRLDEGRDGVGDCPRSGGLVDDVARHLQKWQMLGRVVLDVAHDMKNFLGAILGFTSLMRSSHNSGADELDEIDRVVMRASSVVQRLLELGGRKRTELQRIDLSVQVHDLGPLLHCLAGSRVWLRYELADSLPTVLGFGVDLDQAVINLVANARDACPTGGEIHVETSEAFLTQDLPHACGRVPAGHYAVVAVADTGSGIPAGILKRICEPFFTTKEPGKGTGLGLAIVSEVAQMHNGHLAVWSEPGCGSRFALYLPAAGEPVG
jgi:signal transduction histidine kinase